MLFIASGLALMFCYNATENVQFPDLGIARELVVTSAIFSLILAGPMLVMFSFFEKLSDIKRNPRGRLYQELLDLLADDESQQVVEGKIDEGMLENRMKVEENPTLIQFENNDSKEREEIFYEDLAEESVDNFVNAMKEENQDEINASLTSLQNEPYVERLRIVEITQNEINVEKNKKPEALKVQEIVETVVPADFDKSQLLTLPAEVLVEKLQIEKLGSLTE
jgi:hypothetical protein